MEEKLLGNDTVEIVEVKFNFEDLEVWRRAVKFAQKVIKLVETSKTSRSHYRLLDQMEAATTSVALNIAEGKGRFSKKEFVQHLYIARGSLFEAVTLLQIFHDMEWIPKKEFLSLKREAQEIGKMLAGLADSVKRSITSS